MVNIDLCLKLLDNPENAIVVVGKQLVETKEQLRDAVINELRFTMELWLRKLTKLKEAGITESDNATRLTLQYEVCECIIAALLLAIPKPEVRLITYHDAPKKDDGDDDDFFGTQLLSECCE